MKILIPVDGSANSQRTLEAIIQNKERFEGELVLLHVLEVDKLAYRMIPDFQVAMVREHAKTAGEVLLKEKTEMLAEAGVDCTTRIEYGMARDTICEVANEEEFDLVIIARHTHGEIRDVLFGQVSNHVMHKVKCPVLVL